MTIHGFTWTEAMLLGDAHELDARPRAWGLVIPISTCIMVRLSQVLSMRWLGETVAAMYMVA